MEKIFIMSKLSDKIIFTIIIIILAFSYLREFIEDFTLSVIISVIIYLAILVVYLFFRNRIENTRTITPREMATLFAVMGAENTTKLIYSTLPEEYKIKMKSPYILCEKDGVRYLIMISYKFINLTEDDMANAYREAGKEGIDKIVILARARDRRVTNLANILPVKFFFPDKRAVFRYLYTRNALPTKPQPDKKRQPVKISFEELKDVLFEKRKMKFYLFAGIMTLISSFLTPYTLYYLIFATIPLILAGVCAFQRE